MADMKVFKVEVDTKDAVKNLKDVEVQVVKVITAQEVMQGILTSPEPLKNMAKYIPVYKSFGDITESISKMIPSSVKQMQEAQTIVDKGITKQLEGSKKISEANKKELDDIKKKGQAIDEQNKRLEKEKNRLLLGLEKAEKEYNVESVAEYKKALGNIEKLEKEQVEKAEANSKIRKDALRNTFGDMQKATDDAYAQSKNSINLKYDLEAQSIRNSCDLTLTGENEKMGIKKASAENEQAMMVAQNIKLKDLEERKNAELKKAEQEHQKASTSIVENYLKERSANLTVHVDTTTKKVEKSTKKVIEGLGDFFKDADQATIDSIVKQAVETEKASAKAAETAKKEASATKEATAATKEATDATKKYVDIQETRGKLTGHIKELEDAKQVYLDRIKLYDLEIINAGEDLEKQKELEKQKAEYIKQNAADIIKIQQEITTSEKQQQGLGIVQWQQYAEKFKKTVGTINSLIQQVGSSIKSVFSTITAGIDDEIKAIDDKTKEADIIIAESNARQKEAELEQAERKKEIAEHNKGLAESDANYIIEKNDEKIKSLTNTIEEESALSKQQAAEKNRLDAEKKKKEEEKRKLEKIQRKIDLGMQITSGIANIAEGVTKALAKGPIIGQILAAIQAAQGAVQVAIMTKQLAKLEDGGLLNGKRHSQGGMRIEGSNIEVEGGEYVVNRESTSKNLGLVRYINAERRELKPADLESFFSRSSQGFEPPLRRMLEDGGQLPVVESATNIDNETLVQAIRSIRIEPRVAVTDIHKVQDSMVSVDSWTGV